MVEMRPTVVINHLVEPPDSITGITRYTFGLIEAIIRCEEVRLVLATTWTASHLPPAIAAGLDAVVTLPYISSTPLNNLRQRRRLGRIARHHNADVVYAMNPTCPPVRGIPSAITVHDLYLEMLPKMYKRRHRLWWWLFFRDAARRSGGIAFASLSTAQDAAKLHPRLQAKAHVVPGAGVLPHGDTALPVDLEGAPYVLIIGNITPNKNIGFAVDALRMLSRSGRPVRALHVGRDVNGDLASALADDGESLLQSLGSLDDSMLDAVLRHAACLVQPSRYEGFGLPIIEAQERGVPVIASDIGVFREVAGDAALFVCLDDVKRLAEMMYTITTEASLRARLSEESLANSTRYTWSQSAQVAVSMINGLAQ